MCISVQIENTNLQTRYAQDTSSLRERCSRLQEQWLKSHNGGGNFVIAAASSSSSSPSRRQPSSLPPDLILASQADLQKLNELRRLVQEECDQLVTRKERLQREVVSSNGNWQQLFAPTHSFPNPSSSASNGGSLSLDASFRFSEGSEPTSISSSQQHQQQPQQHQAQHFSPSSALSSLARAYKVY